MPKSTVSGSQADFVRGDATFAPPSATLTIDGTAADIQPLGVQAAGATGKPPDAGHVHPYQPWQFYVRGYGARGDGIMLADVAMAASSKVLTSPSASFSGADVGKHILVNNAGSAPASDTSGALITTIASVQSATQVTLTAAASRTVSAMTAMYGTDDTAAIQAAMNALMAYSGFAGQPYYAELLFDPLVYVLASMPVPGGNLAAGLTYGNAQIPLPVVDLTGLKTKPTVVLRGLTSDNSVLASYHQDVPQITGPCLFSMVEITNANHSDSTYGPVSVIGGPTINTPFGGSNQFNNMLAVVDSLQVVCPPNPGQIALDFFQMAQFAIKTASLDVFASVTGTPTIQFTSGGPTNGNGQGLRVPSAGLNDRCDIDSLSVEGYYYGMSVDEHIAARRVAIIYTNTGIYVPAHGGNQASHGCWIGYASVEICQYCVWSESASGSLFGLYIDVLDNEGPVTEHIHDPSGYLSGKVSILPSNSASLPQAPVVNGAANLEIISLSQPRAVQSAPSYTLGTPFQNPWWRHADVELAGGTVSAVKTGQAAAALTTRAATSGRFRLPSGWWMEIDGTVAPTTFLADTD